MKQHDKQTVILIAGLPGSGKSSLARKHIHKYYGDQNGNLHLICESDLFFTTPSGEYRYDASQIKNAHNWCYLNFYKKLIIDRSPLVIVSNTFTRVWERQQYIDLCNEYNIAYNIIVPETQWAWDVDECFKRNTHSVPLDVIQRMKDRFEFEGVSNATIT